MKLAIPLQAVTYLQLSKKDNSGLASADLKQMQEARWDQLYCYFL